MALMRLVVVVVIVMMVVILVVMLIMFVSGRVHDHTSCICIGNGRWKVVGGRWYMAVVVCSGRW